MPDVGPVAVQASTGTLVVLLLPQVVATKLLPELAAMGVQLETPFGPVVMGVGHVVATYEFPEVAGTGVQEATGTLFVTLLPQVVVV